MDMVLENAYLLERLGSVFVLNSVIFISLFYMFWYTFSLILELVNIAALRIISLI